MTDKPVIVITPRSLRVGLHECDSPKCEAKGFVVLVLKTDGQPDLHVLLAPETAILIAQDLEEVGGGAAEPDSQRVR